MLSGQPCGVWGDGMDCQHDIMSLLASTWDASLLCRCSLLSVPLTSSMGPERQQSMLEQPLRIIWPGSAPLLFCL